VLLLSFATKLCWGGVSDRFSPQKITQQLLSMASNKVGKPTLNNFEQGKTTRTLDSALKIPKPLACLA